MTLADTDQVLNRTAFEMDENGLHRGGEALAALFLVYGAGSMTWFNLRMRNELETELKVFGVDHSARAKDISA